MSLNDNKPLDEDLLVYIEECITNDIVSEEIDGHAHVGFDGQGSAGLDRVRWSNRIMKRAVMTIRTLEDELESIKNTLIANGLHTKKCWCTLFRQEDPIECTCGAAKSLRLRTTTQQFNGVNNYSLTGVPVTGEYGRLKSVYGQISGQ